ncbi:hypothetical protein SUGI_1114030 [Cryptomeria japonica]|nr:hypothetical protein SUGI_1114030 [Cryptomeria japonica]
MATLICVIFLVSPSSAMTTVAGEPADAQKTELNQLLQNDDLSPKHDNDNKNPCACCAERCCPHTRIWLCCHKCCGEGFVVRDWEGSNIAFRDLKLAEGMNDETKAQTKP